MEITGASLIGYHSLTPQRQADLEGFYRSFVNSSRATKILIQSVYDYQRELSAIDYNSE